MFNFFKKKVSVSNVENNDIVAIADGEIIDIKTVSDPVFAQEMMGKSIAFKFPKEKTIICSPANGTLEVMFPTGHAFGITMENGVQLLVHIGINTVEAKENGFTTLVKQGVLVKAGTPIVEVDFKTLSETYDMSTMLIITDLNGHEINFRQSCHIIKGDSILNK